MEQHTVESCANGIHIGLCTVAFPSHVAWAKGYAKSSRKAIVDIFDMPADRWKWRMQCGAVEFVASDGDAKKCKDCDVVVVDSMLDAALIAAELRRSERPPKIVVYMHETQLTTPFVQNDRDVQRGTHWHYAAANWRSVMASDAVFFNSSSHLQQFKDELPKMIKQQAPRDSVDWHLQNAEACISERCAVLPLGLNFLDLDNPDVSDTVHNDAPTLLWNARLEEDKNPDAFVKLLRTLKKADEVFRFVVLGQDPTKDQVWYQLFRSEEFVDELLFCGYCEDRKEYATWLARADVFVSTARHETFGMALLEACYCGVVPLVPRRLSYPEILNDDILDGCMYANSGRDLLPKVRSILSAVRTKSSSPASASSVRLSTLRNRLRKRALEFEWSRVADLYDIALAGVHDGMPGPQAASAAHDVVRRIQQHSDPGAVLRSSEAYTHCTEISTADDDRIALYRPKSLRNHVVYQSQLSQLSATGERPAVHGMTPILSHPFVTLQWLYTMYQQYQDTGHDYAWCFAGCTETPCNAVVQRQRRQCERCDLIWAAVHHASLCTSW
eukprot:m.600670 g.600670  ORF g.600670 m.600670 type:complete len:556 (+) comp22434_c0_seq12:318-1985(+)